MTGQIEDEKLMAYVDGALSGNEQSEIRELLLQDSSLQARVDALREGAELVRRALDDVVREPLPEALLTRIELAGTEDQNNDRLEINTPHKARWVIPVPLVQVAVAACLLLFVGGYIGHWITDGDEQRSGLDSKIADALASATSGTVVPLEMEGRSVDVMPLLTFVDERGRYCRQFLHRVSGPEGGQAFDRVACLERSGAWSPMITVTLDSITVTLDSSVSNDGSYHAANGGEPAFVDRFIETKIDGAPIAGTQEADLIKSGWPSRKKE